MNIFKYIFILFTIVFTSFSAAEERILYKEITDNIPSLNKETEVYLGDRMLVQRHGSWRECITPKESYTKKKMGGWIYQLKAGQPICKEEASAKDYKANYEDVLNGNGDYHPMKIRLSNDKNDLYKLCWRWGGMSGACIKKLSKEDLKVGETFLYTENSFQQTIEYSGKSGNILKFIYSEFQDGFSRQSFNREFQVDLTEGDIVAFKGALLKIHDATNVSIKYSVVRNFGKK